ncbi:MAG: hypothetical protein LBT65_02185 [Synergistaceae bacterium]|nr:hypothetical protein [Synergistaceae bacterium]
MLGYEEATPELFDPVERRREYRRAYYHSHKEKIRVEKARRAEAKKVARVAALPVKTPEEIQAEKEEKLQEKREYQRKYQREWQHRRKEKEAIDKIAHEKVI